MFLRKEFGEQFNVPVIAPVYFLVKNNEVVRVPRPEVLGTVPVQEFCVPPTTEKTD